MCTADLNSSELFQWKVRISECQAPLETLSSPCMIQYQSTRDVIAQIFGRKATRPRGPRRITEMPRAGSRNSPRRKIILAKRRTHYSALRTLAALSWQAHIWNVQTLYYFNVEGALLRQQQVNQRYPFWHECKSKHCSNECDVIDGDKQMYAFTDQVYRTGRMKSLVHVQC